MNHRPQTPRFEPVKRSEVVESLTTTYHAYLNRKCVPQAVIDALLDDFEGTLCTLDDDTLEFMTNEGIWSNKVIYNRFSLLERE